MWTNSRTAGAALKILHYCKPTLLLRRDTDRLQRRICRFMSSSGPPWRLLFFGTDHFATESLKLLTSSRSSGIVESVEVVTFSGEVPVKKFAEQNNLTVHSWPPDIADGQFDVGVVVSFGCLLREGLINKFPYGILNVHPSLLPRWRGPAPIFHTILHGDTVTGVTIIQIRPHRFDVGPILNQELHQVSEKCTADELGAVLAIKGAHLLVDTLKTLTERLPHKREQGEAGATFAPKITTSMSWVVWEEQTCDQIDHLYRAIGFMDGWVGFRTVLLKKRLSATDFYNGYLHRMVQEKMPYQTTAGLFVSRKYSTSDQRKSSVVISQQ
ncbi:hypothetical protein INR49_028830 [Caranx melampygus]|nr:hypothetical protein INR49_028830 [Caranx melampygus]